MSAFSEVDISNTFHRYTQLVQLLPQKPSDDDLLTLYGYYKQATLGDCNILPPTGLFDFKGKRKWAAWNMQKGTNAEDAMKQYVSKVKSLME